MSPLRRSLLFLLFFVSGFCGLLYQVVWTRLAFASFGIIAPVLSVVISVFMLGLSLGAWAGGRWIDNLVRTTGLSAVLFYALAELLIGSGAFAVPNLFGLGEHLLLATGQGDSLRYLLLSALVLAVSILPWCVCMGATFPLMMAYVRERGGRSTDSFSFLYLANVLGALAGVLLTALVLIECLGFRHTLWVAAAGNFVIAGISLKLGIGKSEGRPAAAARQRGERPKADPLRQSDSAARGSPKPEARTPKPEKGRARLIQWVLFSTGFVSMAMEVVWIRAFAPVLKTQVYSFALVVATYLGATFLGSLLYRRHLKRGSLRPLAELIALLCIAVLLPILANDPHWVKANWEENPDCASVLLLLASIAPFCGILGYLTPGLVDEYAAGSPSGAGRAYALNVLGCILGPLFASYILLPWIGERSAILLSGLPLFGFWFAARRALSLRKQWGLGLAAGAALVWALFFSQSYVEYLFQHEKNTEVRRDYAASVISFGEDRIKDLLVNGVGMTTLNPVTKFMAHLPLAFHRGQPESVLVICFGMGTSYRSALSWDIRTTAVELVPSVVRAFGFYHADAARLLRHPKGQVIIDDGRRFLKRTGARFDVIVVDPPPPPEAAGSSLLYSTEFYELVKQRLRPDGILQMWLLNWDPSTVQAALRSIHESFPHVRCFGSVDHAGMHVLASMSAIPSRSAEELAARLPAEAKRDLLEWAPAYTLPAYLDQAVSRELPIEEVLNPDPRVCITDDRPYNEYFLLRNRSPARKHYYRGLALDSQGQAQEALVQYREAARLSPNTALYLGDLAWFLATNPKAELRDGAEAVRLAERACELSGGKEARFWGTLDAAYAEAGRFADARATAAKTRELALAAGEPHIAQQAEERLALYRLGKPYRTAAPVKPAP